MKIFTTINLDYLTNVYFVTDNEQKYGVIIDPGSFSMNVYKLVQSTGAVIKKIIITHNDIEQTGGIALIKKIYNAEIYAYDQNIQDFKAKKVRSGTVIKEGELHFIIFETPVHSYDSISILIEDSLFIGEIFQAGTLCSFRENEDPSHYEYDIIKKNILSLKDHVVIYPGKGPSTTVEIERKFNPYFRKILNEKNR